MVFFVWLSSEVRQFQGYCWFVVKMELGREGYVRIGQLGQGVEGIFFFFRVQLFILGGFGYYFSSIDFEGIIGEDGNQDDVKNLQEQGQGWYNKGYQVIRYQGKGGGWYGIRCELEFWVLVGFGGGIESV